VNRIKRYLALLLLGCVLAGPGVAQTVSLLADDPTPSVGEFMRLLETELTRTRPGLRLQRIDKVGEVDSAARVIVAIGSKGLRQALAAARATPVVGALVPSSLFDELSARGKATAVFLEQPPSRQLALLNLLLPDARRVGILVGRAQKKDLAPLALAAESARLHLQTALVDSREALFDALQQITATSDVLLAWPDATVFNPQTIQSILLTTYRQRVPMLGFSAAYTKAGALASVHSSVAQLAVQTSELVLTVLAGNQLPAPQAPREFEVSVNRQVGRSLGIELPDERVLVDQMRAREGKLKP
jgi:putative tryptophan/tyrosine transport system substrate-binding protein